MEGKASQRNLGIDALRCLGMLFIVCLHVLNQGGAGQASGAGAICLLPLKMLCNCGVNLYAVISGWVLVYGRFRPARLAELWLQVMFWNLTLALIGTVMEPGCMDGLWPRYCLPVTMKCLWYFSAYVGLYILTPLLNPGIRNLSVRQARAVALAVFLLFSVVTHLSYTLEREPWGIGAGYSVLWLLALYLLGACARQGKLDELLSPKTCLLLALGCMLLFCVLVGLLDRLGELPYFWKNQRKVLMYYTSPVFTVFALSMLLLFVRLQIPKGMRGLIRWLSPLTFGVYILHTHQVIWTQIQNRYKPLAALPALLAPLSVLAAGAGLLLLCAGLDWLRALLFRRIRLRQVLDAAFRKLKRLE